MTHKEAIAQIKGMRFQVQSSLDEVEVDVDCKEAEEDNREIVEAFDMAIKALDREESVLKALDDVRAEVEAKEQVEVSVKEQYFNFALTEVTEIIDRKIKEIKHERS